MFIESERLGPEAVESAGQAMGLSSAEIRDLGLAVARSEPALLMTFDSRPLWACGFIPLNLFGTKAYAWMQWSPEIYRHPVAVSRKGKEIFAEALKIYPVICGHCTYGSRPIRFLTKLGAKFTTDTEGRPFYIMGGEG